MLVETREKELVDPKNTLFDKVVKNANESFQYVDTIKNGTKDAKLMADLSKLLTDQVKQVGASNQTITTTLLSNCLARAFKNDGDVDYAKVGFQARVFFRAIPSFDSMLGSAAIKPPPKKEKVKREKVKIDNSAPVEKPKLLQKRAEGGDAAEAEAEDDESNLFKLHPKLQSELTSLLDQAGGGEVNMFDVVVDPQSFTQTVENVFALSFLVKDTKVRMDVKDDVPVVCSFASTPNKPKDVQFVATLDHATWKRICEEFEIEKGQMQHRVLPIYDDVRK